MDLKNVSTMELSSQLPLPLIHCPAVHVSMHERGSLEPVLAKDLLVIMRAVLTATVGMMDAALGRCPERDGHLQRPDRQITLHAVANRCATVDTQY